MSTVDAIIAQYQKNATSGNSNNRMSNEDKLKKFFSTILPKGSKGEERRIRILPTKDGSSPFVEVLFHEIQVDGKWVKLYDPKQDGKRSPLDEVYKALLETKDEDDRKAAMQYRSRKYYIVKVIDRDNEQDGPKFWRFKHNSKNEGTLDKIFPIFRNKGDITDPLQGRDLILSLNLSKANNGGEYTIITSVIPDDKSPLHADEEIAKSWIDNDLKWSDVYSIKSEEYLDIVASGGVPRWDSTTNKYVSNLTSEETLSGTATSSQPVDPQEENDVDDDLPF